MTDRIARMFPIAALCVFSAVALAACGGGGGKKAAPTPTDDQMRVMPAVDHPDTLGEALAIEAGQAIDGRIDSAGDRDFFRLPLTEASRVTFWTSGEADTLVALLDGEGNDLAADTDGRASVETELSNVYARVRGGPDGGTGGYRLHNEVVARAGGNGSPGEEMNVLLNHCVGEFEFFRDDNRENHGFVGQSRSEDRCLGEQGEIRFSYSVDYTNQCDESVDIFWGFDVRYRSGDYQWHRHLNLQPGRGRRPALGARLFCDAPPTSLLYCAESSRAGKKGPCASWWDGQQEGFISSGFISSRAPIPPFREIRIDAWVYRILGTGLR